MNKTYIIDGLGCANCAAKMERKIQEIAEVETASVVFATCQLRVTAPDPDSLLPQMQEICQSIEDHVEVKHISNSVPARSLKHDEPCGCEHIDDHNGCGCEHTDDHNECVCEHKSSTAQSLFKEHARDIISIIAGALLFAAGIIINQTGILAATNESANAQTSVPLCASTLIPLIIFGAAYLILGGKVLMTAVKNIARGQIFDENFLMAIATIAAFCIGDFAEGAGVMLFYRVGEFFENIAVEKSRTQIMEAVDMRPETVQLIHSAVSGEANADTHGTSESETVTIPAEQARPGDILLIRPGDRIPLDGIITEGESRIDTSPVTGEPVPVRVTTGSEVISGCINEQGVLKMEVTKPLSESMVTRILNSVENAAAGKPKIDKFITRFARVYTPIVVILAILTAIIPSLITGEWSKWIEAAITFLVISCPCALVISVPLAFFAGIGAASKLGILFKSGMSIEALKKIKTVIMDKTGTITQGNFVVQRISTANGATENDVLKIAAVCEENSTHPIALSIMQKARELGFCTDSAVSGGSSAHPNASESAATTVSTLNIEEIAGKGICAQLQTGQALCGNTSLMKQFGIEITNTSSMSDETYEASAASTNSDTNSGTLVHIAHNGIYLGCISISDTLKSDAASAVSAIKATGLTPAMLTGDSKASADAVAHAVGIEEVRAELLPEDKLTALQELRQKHGPAMFVGDGINDAPVLAGADIGAAMGSGSGAAIEAADIVFINSSVEAIPQSTAIAKATGRIAIQNVTLALAIKLLVILLGLAGFANIWAAIFADTGVAMLCILNSLRILWKNFLK